MEVQDLDAAWTTTCNNAWNFIDPPDPSLRREEMILFTDASDYGWGFVACDGSGNIFDTGAYAFDAPRIGWHIFIKEVAAACWSLQRFPEYGRIALFVDNTAAQYALQRGYSSNTIALKCISYTFMNMLGTRTFHRITSKLNPADEPSRGLVVVAEKARIALESRYKVADIVTAIDTSESMRHSEPRSNEEDEVEAALSQWNFDPTELTTEEYRQDRN